MTEYAIEINGLKKTYKDFTLAPFDLKLPWGCIMGLVGENGAGKTTIIKAMLGIIHPDPSDTSHIRLLGMDLNAHEKEIKELVGVVFGESHFHEFLTAGEVSEIMRGVYKNWDDACYRDLIGRFGLPETKKLKTYSKGMMMKLSIAAALSHHPRLLLLDEATSGLDPVVRDEILDLLFGFIQDGRHAVLLSSHITSDLDKVADYITMLHKGKLIFTEEKDVLLEKMGVVRCSADSLGSLTGLSVCGVRSHSYGVECMVSNKKEVRAKYPDLVVDDTNIEEIMVFCVKGGEQ